ncbi:MAG: di-heme oxidoredictase family protein [Saprospiraceae bacterium]
MSSLFSSKIILFLGIFLLISCDQILPSIITADELIDRPIEGLSIEQNRLFIEGAKEFDEVYIRETGLGPIFVSTSCSNCHSGANRGHPLTLLTRFGQSDTFGNNFLNKGAPQLQNNFITGYQAERIPAGATFTKLIAPIVSGNGLLELVSETDILKLSDPNDENSDGISGKVNWNTIPSWIVPSSTAQTQNGKYICRFGRKASTYNLIQQCAQAFNQDIGITTTLLPYSPVNYLDGLNSSPISDLDITDRSLNATVFYIQTLQEPIQRNTSDQLVIEGAQIFKKIQCNACHVEKLQTSYSPISALNKKEFFPYTDLLLHDMGSELDDQYTEGTAMAYEWRTTPLWGLGLAKKSQGNELYLMHDGRARSIEDAILLHGGESAISKTNFKQLSESEKKSLIKFLESL